MSEAFTKSMARNIFYGGSLFFILLFLALTFDTHGTFPERANTDQLTEKVAHGKEVWEENNCTGCHTLHGEGSFFAPELGNVYTRFGSKEAIKGWIKAQPTGVPGRRQMPHFDLTEEELEALASFLKWADEMDTAGWPPNVQG